MSGVTGEAGGASSTTTRGGGSELLRGVRESLFALISGLLASLIDAARAMVLILGPSEGRRTIFLVLDNFLLE